MDDDIGGDNFLHEGRCRNAAITSAHKSPVNKYGERWINQDTDDETDSDEHEKLLYERSDLSGLNELEIVDVKMVSYM